MPKEQVPGKPTSRRYSPEEKAAAVRMVRALRAELGTEQGMVSRVARQLGYGVESVRSWVRQADIDDGYSSGVSTLDSQRIKQLERENRDLKEANEILKSASIFFARELCATRRQVYREVVRDRLCWAVAAA
jgi:transposase